MNLSEQEIQTIVAATVAALEKGGAGGRPDMPISNQQQSRALTIPANSQRHVPFLGSYIAIYSNTSTNSVLVSMDNGISNFIKAGTGYPCVRLSRDKTTYEPAVFKRVTFENTTNEDMTIEYVLSLGPVTDTRAVVEGWLQVDLSAPSLLTPAPEAIATDNATILAANALLKERLVQNTGEYPIWWGDDSVDPDTKRGLAIHPGGFATINCHGAVYLKAEEGASVLSINNIMKG